MYVTQIQNPKCKRKARLHTWEWTQYDDVNTPRKAEYKPHESDSGMASGIRNILSEDREGRNNNLQNLKQEANAT
jgi:hypothetical protein